MLKSLNKPYVKQFDAKGNCINRIEAMPGRIYASKVFLGMRKDEFGEEYPVFFPNHSERRALLKKKKINNRSFKNRNRHVVRMYSPEVVKRIHLLGFKISELSHKTICDYFETNLPLKTRVLCQ